MAIQEDIFTIGKEKLNQMKAFVEEVEVQLKLGKAEARDAFERERKEFMNYIQQRRDAFRHVENEMMADKNELTKKFDELEDKLKAEAAQTKDAFDKQKQVILHAIYEVEHAIKENYGDVAEEMKEYMNSFKAKLDAYRIQLALGKFEDENKLEGKKAELRDAVGQLREQIVKEDMAREKLDKISTELNVAFDHLKKAFKEVFN